MTRAKEVLNFILIPKLCTQTLFQLTPKIGLRIVENYSTSYTIIEQLKFNISKAMFIIQMKTTRAETIIYSGSANLSLTHPIRPSAEIGLSLHKTQSARLLYSPYYYYTKNQNRTHVHKEYNTHRHEHDKKKQNVGLAKKKNFFFFFFQGVEE